MSADEYVLDTASETNESDTSLKPRISQPLDILLNDLGSMSPPVCDTTTPDHVTFDSNSITSEVTGGEQPCSSQDAIDNIVVSVLVPSLKTCAFVLKVFLFC